MTPRNAQAQASADPNHIAGLIPEQKPALQDLHKAEDERAAAAREDSFKIECMQKESEACIAANTAAVAATPISAPD